MVGATSSEVFHILENLTWGRTDNPDSFYFFFLFYKGKGKGFPYSTPSVGPGDDPGVQANG